MVKPSRGKPGASALVYSTDGGGRCRQCLRVLADCICGVHAPEVRRSAGDGVVRLSRETKGRKGAGVTLISGLPLTGVELDALATRLKKFCGAGGTVRDGVIEIQTDQRARLQTELERLGWRVKIAGG